MKEKPRRWVLKSEARNYFLCASGEDPRAALCVFPSRESAEEHLESLSEPKMFLDSLERHGTEMPDWMHDETLMPEPCEISEEDLRNILEATDIEYVALGAEERDSAMEVFFADEFLNLECE